MTRHTYDSIRAEVLARIRRRDWPPGTVIPGEEDLAAEFNVARATVHRALRELADSGLLERRRRAGTRVAELPARRATLEIPVIRQEVSARGQTYGFTLLADRIEVPPVPFASRAGWEQGAAKRYLETLHLADGRPFALECRWLDPAILSDPAPDFAMISANEWLVQNVPFAGGNIAFAAEGASDAEGAILGIPPATPVLITDRATFGLGGTITLVRLIHAPGYRVQTVL